MNSEHIYDAITKVNDGLVDAAGDFRNEGKCKPHKRNLRKHSIYFAVTAFATAAAILVGIIFLPDTASSPILKASAIVEAEYPERSQYAQVSNDYIPILSDFAVNNIRTMLSGTESNNRTVSPLNIYMALSMMAEITDGNSRAQILDVLGCSDIEELRSTANAVWHANYRNSGTTTNLLASSLWLSNSISYNTDTLNALADNYYADSYRGEMGSPELDSTLQSWLNEQTGGQLSDQISNVSLNPLTAIALATTVQFHGKWQSKFNESATAVQTFHSPTGDIDCDFMRKSENRYLYWGDNFSAVCLYFSEGGYLKILLPDEGYTTDDLLADETVLSFMTSRPHEWENKKMIMVRMRIPKFDISSQLELSDTLKSLGITDAFDATVSDYSPLTENCEASVKLSEVRHGTRVVIDESGCTATAFTLNQYETEFVPPEEEVDFVADRPFLFVISYRDNLPLFAGVVNQPIQ